MSRAVDLGRQLDAGQQADSGSNLGHQRMLGQRRHRLLEDLSRVFSESGANIMEARCLSNPPMVKNRFVVEVADTHSLKGAINRLRNTESVFDAYRVTPGAG